jgi:hypothetical protein
MVQQDVIDLNQRVQAGATVLVLNADGSMPKNLRIPTPPKPKQSVAKALAKPKPVIPALEIKTVTYQPPAAAAVISPTMVPTATPAVTQTVKPALTAPTKAAP